MYSNDEDQSIGGNTADELEQVDLIEGVDEDGNTILLEVIRYFFYNGEEFVILGEVQQTECGEDHDDGHEDDDEEEDYVNVYVMKVVPSEEDDEMEEFVPVENEDLLEQLIRIAEATFEEEDQDEIED